MDWEIFSIGDGAFLERILNSVAMLTGSGQLDRMAAIGFLIGVFVVGIKAIVDGGRMPAFHFILVAWLLYAGFFGSTARVTITDVYKDEVRVVDNVPLGVAASGHFISAMGYQLTQLFEQAFGSVSMTDDGFGYALDALADVQRATLTQDDWGNASSPQDGMNVYRSWTNYVKECTMVGAESDQYTVEEIKTGSRFPTENAMEQLRFDSESYGTRIYTEPNDRDGGYYNCLDAFDRLSTVTIDQSLPLIKQNIAQEMAVYDQEFAPQGAAAADAADMKVQGSLQVLNQAGVNAQDYMIASAMYPVFNWGQAHNAQDWQRTSQAGMIHDAIQQRNTQWAGEQALFQAMIHPVMTFFEGFIFAITPFMAFLIALGPVGIGIAAKYFFIVLWIQLWMPVLAIVNLFLHMSAEKGMTSLQGGEGYNEVSLASFYGVAAADAELQNWIATGGLLASSVPALTLMLIYGSSVTATNLSGRLQSGDFVDEKRAAPDTSNVGAGTNVQAVGTYDRVGGQAATNAQGTLPSIKGSEGFTESVKSAESNAQTANNTFQDSFQDAFGNSENLTQEQSKAVSEIQSRGATGQSVEKANESVSSKVMESGELSSKTSESQVNTATRALSSKIGAMAKGSGVSADFKNEVAESTGMSREDVDKIADTYEESMSGESSLAASYEEGLKQDFASGEAEKYGEVLNASQTESLTNSASEAVSASETYEELASKNTDSNVGRSKPVNVVAQDIAQDEGLQGQLNSWLDSEQGALQRGNIDRLASDLHNRGNMTEGDAQNAAAAAQFAKQGTTESGQFVSDLLGMEAPTDGSGRNSDVSEDMRGVDGAAGQGDVPTDSGSAPDSLPSSEPVDLFRQAQEGEVAAQKGQYADDAASDRTADVPENSNPSSAGSNSSGSSNMFDFMGGISALNDHFGGNSSNQFRDQYGDGFDGGLLSGDAANPAQMQELAREGFSNAQSYMQENYPDMPTAMQDAMAYSMMNENGIAIGGTGVGAIDDALGFKGPAPDGINANNDRNPGNLLDAERGQIMNGLNETFGQEGAAQMMDYMSAASAPGVSDEEVQSLMQQAEGQMARIEQGNAAMGGSGGMQAPEGAEYARQRQELLDTIALQEVTGAQSGMENYRILTAMPEDQQALVGPEIGEARAAVIGEEGTRAGNTRLDRATSEPGSYTPTTGSINGGAMP